jgi:hypothetical protein
VVQKEFAAALHAHIHAHFLLGQGTARRVAGGGRCCVARLVCSVVRLVASCSPIDGRPRRTRVGWVRRPRLWFRRAGSCCACVGSLRLWPRCRRGAGCARGHGRLRAVVSGAWGRLVDLHGNPGGWALACRGKLSVAHHAGAAPAVDVVLHVTNQLGVDLVPFQPVVRACVCVCVCVCVCMQAVRWKHHQLRKTKTQISNTRCT